MTDSSTHVLLIEDNPGDADLVRLRLVESNPAVDVSCVKRLADGLESLKREVPSLILLDLNLPDSQGAETFRKILEQAPGVPVVILSGQDDQALAIKALHQGAQDYLLKSRVTSTDLDRAMRYAVERQALLRSLEMSRKQQLEFKNQFLSHVSHELRTPLTCIHQYVTILLDGLAGEVKPGQREHLNTILRSVNQLGAMVRDLLEAARAESGKITLDLRCMSLEEQIRLAVAMIKSTATQKGVGIEVGFEGSIPFVLADPDRVLEILINLVDNAVKFTPAEGSVTVQVGRMVSDPGFICISVSDTGRGITPEARSLVFERLYQDPNAVDNNRKGLGLGLFIAKELVTLHGGRIWVASDGATGSTFSFTLPLYSLPKLLQPVITHEGQLRSAFALLRIDLRPKTSVRGSWKELGKKVRDLVERCVYLDKDLVLPPMTMSGPEQTFFVVASTDMERSAIMLNRIREQLQKCEELSANGEFALSAQAIGLPALLEGFSLEQQVQFVSDTVTEMVKDGLGIEHGSAGVFN